MAEQGSFVDADGVTVAYRSWLATADLRGVAVIAHGASEHSGRYGRFADALAAAGSRCCARPPRPRVDGGEHRPGRDRRAWSRRRARRPRRDRRARPHGGAHRAAAC